MFFRRKKSNSSESESTEVDSSSDNKTDATVNESGESESSASAILESDTNTNPNTETELQQTGINLAAAFPELGGSSSALVDDAKTRSGIFAKIKRGLSRTSNQLGDGFGALLLGKKEIDEELLEDLENQLLLADVGIDATDKIISDLTQRVGRNQLTDGNALYEALKESLRTMLGQVEAPLQLNVAQKPFVLLVVGVNGVGKTTTIGKLAKRFQLAGKSVMLAAGDTFRAAAVEQLKVWGERNDVTVVAQASGSDSASVIYDAVASAKARNIDIIIADTAGRLHNKSHLMDELSKVKRVIQKLDANAPHEILLVLDAGTGQNAINQAQHFIDAVGVTGIALTKLDGTAKGGVIFALSERFGIPVRYIGVGEAIDDLQPFSASAFVDALFPARQ